MTQGQNTLKVSKNSVTWQNPRTVERDARVEGGGKFWSKRGRVTRDAIYGDSFALWLQSFHGIFIMYNVHIAFFLFTGLPLS